MSIAGLAVVLDVPPTAVIVALPVKSVYPLASATINVLVPVFRVSSLIVGLAKLG